MIESSVELKFIPEESNGTCEWLEKSNGCEI